MRSRPLTEELMALLGEDAFVKLCQSFGGTKLYAAGTIREDSEIVKAIGMEAAQQLSRSFSRMEIPVPLARRERALFYRRAGKSNREIARLLGITDSAAIRLLKREGGLRRGGGAGITSAQLKLL